MSVGVDTNAEARPTSARDSRCQARRCQVFPNTAVAGLCYVAWSSVLTVPILFPLSGFMMLEYGVADTREDAGYLAGFLASCFMIGRTISAAPWGVAADKYGLIPVMALCTVLSALGTGAVGFVDDYFAAVALRIATGLANPIIALVKGLLPDMVPHEQQHRAMTIITAQWQFGLITGPSIGGFLAYPCGSGDSLAERGDVAMDHSETWICSKPFLLPLLACCMLQVTGLIPLYRLVRPRVEATRARKVEGQAAGQSTSKMSQGSRPHSTAFDAVETKDSDDELVDAESGTTPSEMPSLSGAEHRIELADRVRRSVEPSLKSSVIGRRRRSHKAYSKLAESGDASGEISVDTCPSSLPAPRADRAEVDARLEAGEAGHDTKHESDADSIFDSEEEQIGGASKEMQQLSITVATAKETKAGVDEGKKADERNRGKAGVAGTGSEMRMSAMLQDPHFYLLLKMYCFLSLVGITAQELSSLFMMTPTASGGLGAETADIGRVFSAVGASCLLFQVTVGPAIVKHIGLLRSLTYGMSVTAASATVIPFVPQLLPARLGFSDSWRFSALIIALAVRACSDYMCFSTIFVLLNNSVPPECRGRANGLAMTFASIFKAIGPTLGGAVYAWSVNLRAAPMLDAHLSFFVIGVATVLARVLLASKIPEWASEAYEAQPGRSGSAPKEFPEKGP